jgi:hypothetical protein
MVGLRLSFKLVSGVLGISIYIIRNLSIVTGFILIIEVLKLLNEPKKIFRNIKKF